MFFNWRFLVLAFYKESSCCIVSFENNIEYENPLRAPLLSAIVKVRAGEVIAIEGNELTAEQSGGSLWHLDTPFHTPAIVCSYALRLYFMGK